MTFNNASSLERVFASLILVVCDRSKNEGLSEVTRFGIGARRA
ncbi:hypothetical protein SULPSESMR1_01789 [Pseudosulfitobacter pseudonitzschiae]|uniref:Uncharacterized protein n=1 Tax=Pseudosulfitobacter pseudonitzschiae TaxID=1402135 RepID=A0A221K198_9RHOB|nr:hypothetical protein SULPSESMR1_01789 [Pseudosulfitobacter pseudonitzschiae]